MTRIAPKRWRKAPKDLLTSGGIKLFKTYGNVNFSWGFVPNHLNDRWIYTDQG